MKGKKLAKKIFPVLTAVFTVIVIYFLYQVFSKIDWEKVVLAIQELSAGTLALCLAMVFVNYLILSTYDYMGFRYLRTQKLSYLKTAATALISYAFNFNLGALIGGLGFRIRMYSGWGIPKKTTTMIALLSVGTTWLGFTLLSSIFILAKAEWLPQRLFEHSLTLKLLSILALVIVGVYFIFCKQRKVLKLKGRTLTAPPLSYAFIQSFLAISQWSLASFIAFTFMREMELNISYPQALFTFLAASLGGVVARIPSGMGVLEAIFLKLNENLPSAPLLAAIISFRAVYYIVPLMAAIPSYIAMEIIQRRGPNK
ncbi:MAG: hypothetical protein CME64_13875 [Halobacteriovoraceae bacterium]|nr:hypothetical protein [Halobacteriovoraceae bacterium]|tara:strand:+ start:17155 stop:18093 length:939 start_codon:yes stop_codon:yes gene_type:complete